MKRLWAVDARTAVILAQALTLALGSTGCADRDRLAAELRAAASEERMPRVVACWEKAFEEAGFRGSYLAVVDFSVEAETGRVHGAEVGALYDTSTGRLAPAGSTSLRSCLVEALEQTTLGGGWRPSQDLTVSGFSIAFVDTSEEARRAASEDAPTVLVGPRADRCQGLYAHEPPRDAAALAGELGDAQAEAERARRSDPDRHARALQRAYDTALELRQRLALDGRRGGLSRDGRERLIEASQRAFETARQIGSKIGCNPR